MSILRWFEVTPKCWEKESLYWAPAGPADAQISVDKDQPDCGVEKRGSPFIFSDLYVRKDLWLGVFSICVDGRNRVQIVIVNYYFYRVYHNIDWTAEVRSLMVLHNDTLSEDVVALEIGKFQEQFFLYNDEEVCDPGCADGPVSMEKDEESFPLIVLLGIYLIMIIVIYVCLMQIFN